jgi:transposase
MRVEVLGAERRRRWSSDEKARLVAETLAPGARVSEVARRNEVAPSLLFTWRRQARVRRPTPEPVFLPVRVTAEPRPASPSARSSKRQRKAAGTIAIDLGSGRRLTVGADVDAAALARVLDVLERR